MDKVRTIAYGLCCISIVYAFFSGASPKFGEKFMKFISGIMILIIILSFPIKNSFNNIFQDNYSNEFYNEDILKKADDIFIKATEENIKSVIKQELNSINITAEEIKIDIIMDEYKNIKINYAEVILPPELVERQKEVEEVLKKLGIKSKGTVFKYENSGDI